MDKLKKYDNRGLGRYECSECGVVFYKSESLRDKRINHFCGRKCYAIWRSKNLTGKNNYHPKAKNRKYIQCSHCRKTFEIAEWRTKRAKNNFCSLQCKLNFSWSESSLRERIRFSKKYKDWRYAVMCRDKFKCKKCNSKESLEAHHIKHFAQIIKDNNITSIRQAKECEELWDINNGETLCIHCHAEEHPDNRNLILRIAI